MKRTRSDTEAKKDQAKEKIEEEKAETVSAEDIPV